MAAKRPSALDRIDVKILAALQRDGRSTIQKLAQTVGLSPRASLERKARPNRSGDYHWPLAVGQFPLDTWRYQAEARQSSCRT